jgi:hypothetical protein
MRADEFRPESEGLMKRSRTATAIAVVAVVALTGLWTGGHRGASAAERPSRCVQLRAAGSPSTASDIATQVCQLRERGFDLGAEASGIVATPTRPGAMQHFANVSLYWSPATGVGWVMGEIRDKWAQTGWENGVLGFPRTGENVTPDGRGRYTHFEFGSIYWTPETRAHEVHGAIVGTWATYGWERAGGPTGGSNPPPWALGYPTTDELTAPDGRGRANFFENGAIYWSPDSGAHRVYGRILDAWARNGFETVFGYPIEEPRMGNSVGSSWCLYDRNQTFIRPDGNGGTFCEQPGFVDYRPRTKDPVPGSGGLASGVRMGGGRPATTGPVQPGPPMDMGGAPGAWICARGGNYSIVPSEKGGPIPAGLVATQYDTAGCNDQSPSGSMYVTRPQHDQWICAWGDGAIDGYVIDKVEPSSPLCADGIRRHIVKIA